MKLKESAQEVLAPDKSVLKYKMSRRNQKP